MMELTDLETITALNKEREELIKLRQENETHEPQTFIAGQGISSLIPSEIVRAAIYHALHERLVAIDSKLFSLGVRVGNHHIARAGDAAAWQRESDMFKGAWLRELGGKLINKSHFIDALVLTTREMKERDEMFKPLVQALDRLSETVKDKKMPPDDSYAVSLALNEVLPVLVEANKLIKDQEL